MSFSVIQAGSTLQFIDSNHNVSTLTLPTGVTLRVDVPPRFSVFGRFVILVNTPSQPLTIDGTGTVRLLTPKPPRVSEIVSGVAGGTLSGTYGNLRYTFITFDAVGNIISESDFSPASNTVTITNQFLKASNLDISPDQISARRLYRPTTGGTTLFHWLDLDGNVLTSVQDDLSDAGLQLVAAPILGTPPRLTMIAEFRDRLWGVGDTDIDDLFYTETGVIYSWPALNFLPIPRVGSDDRGITALLPRRESLGVGRQNLLLQITGVDATDFRVVKLSENLGVESQESVAIWRDTAYFLWKDGVYQWNTEGLRCISDGLNGKGMVRSWFTTDNYFDRSQFQNAFGVVDPVRDKYRLFLREPLGTIKWVEYDFVDGTWWGPHKTDAFTPTCTFTLAVNNVLLPMIGSSNANVWHEQPFASDGSGTNFGIDFNVDSKDHNMETPDRDKVWGELSILGKVQSSGTVTVTPTVGYLSNTAQTPLSYDMTQGRQRLGRMGIGKTQGFNFRHTAPNEPVELYGYEQEVIDVGRR